MNTSDQFDLILAECQQVFEAKTKDYGTSWRVLRPASLTDQIYIKARRIRIIEEKGVQKVEEPIQNEYIGIINYCIIALIQLDLEQETELNIAKEHVFKLYTHYVAETKSLMLAKNHDYGEAWRNMRSTSFTDLILMKLMRIKQIERNEGKTEASENVEAGYTDIINYAVFALILMQA